VRGIAPLEEAGPGQVAFLSNPRYLRLARETKASALIVREPLAGAACAFLLSPNPYDSFARAVEVFHPPVRHAAGISPLACVDPGASIGRDASIGPFAVVEKGATVGDRSSLYSGVYIGMGAAVGEDCVLYPRVVLYEGVRVGNRAILHAGCVIGSDGFGFAPSSRGFRKIPQVGTVEIGDDVEIGANSAIDRAAMGVTRIGRGTKLDNMVHVGHNVAIGIDTVIAAQTGISGSCRIGSRVMVGGQAGFAGHIEVGDGVMLGGQTGVASSIDASETSAWSGTPAMPHRTWLKMSTLLPKLPELFRRVRKLEDGNPGKEEE